MARIDGAGAGAARRPRQRAMRVRWPAFVDALRAENDASLLQLPGRMRLVDVPEQLSARCDGCLLHLADDAFGEVGALATAGYCEETGAKDVGADCATADKGMVPMAVASSSAEFDGGGASPGGASRPVIGPIACLRYLSTMCPRARFASVSVSEKDCSWYHSCDLAKLKQSGLGHRSFDLSQPAVRRALVSSEGASRRGSRRERRREATGLT